MGLFFSSDSPFPDNTKASRGTDGEDTALPRLFLGHLLYQVAAWWPSALPSLCADRQCWAWVGFDVPSDACLHTDFSSLVPMPKQRA